MEELWNRNDTIILEAEVPKRPGHRQAWRVIERKPDPRHLTETIRLAGGDPDNAVMVGDSQTDIDTAKAAGIPVVAVDFG